MDKNININLTIAGAENVINKLNLLGNTSNKTGLATVSSIGRIQKAMLALQAVPYASNILKGITALDTGLRDVGTLVDNFSKEKLEGWKTQMRSFTSMPVETEQLTKAMYQNISALRGEKDMFSMVELQAKAAKAGLADVGQTADLTTSILNAYKMENKDTEGVLDKMLYTVKLGKTTFGELGQHLGLVIPVAANAGVEFNDLMSAMAAMTLVGIKTPEAVTALRQSIIQSTQASGEQKKMMKSLGLEWTNLIDFVGQLKRANLTEDQWGKLFPEVRAQLGLKAMVNQYEQLLDIQKRMKTEAPGATQQMYGIQEDSIESQLMVLKKEALSIGKELFSAILPALPAILQAIKQIADYIHKIPEPVRNTIIQALIAKVAMDKMGVSTGVMKAGFLGVGKVVKEIGSGIAGAFMGGGITAFGAKITTLFPYLGQLKNLLTSVAGFGGGAGAAAGGATIAGLAFSFIYTGYEITKFILEANKAEKAVNDFSSKSSQGMKKTTEDAAKMRKSMEEANTLTAAFIKGERTTDSREAEMKRVDETIDGLIVKLGLMKQAGISESSQQYQNVKKQIDTLNQYKQELNSISGKEFTARVKLDGSGFYEQAEAIKRYMSDMSNWVMQIGTRGEAPKYQEIESEEDRTLKAGMRKDMENLAKYGTIKGKKELPPPGKSTGTPSEGPSAGPSAGSPQQKALEKWRAINEEIGLYTTKLSTLEEGTVDYKNTQDKIIELQNSLNGEIKNEIAALENKTKVEGISFEEYLRLKNIKEGDIKNEAERAILRSQWDTETNESKLEEQEKVKKLTELYGKQHEIQAKLKELNSQKFAKKEEDLSYEERLASASAGYEEDLALQRYYLDEKFNLLNESYKNGLISTEEYNKRMGEIVIEYKKQEVKESKDLENKKMRNYAYNVELQKQFGNILWAQGHTMRQRTAEALKQSGLQAMDTFIFPAIARVYKDVPFPLNIPAAIAVGGILYALRNALSSVPTGVASEGGVFTKPTSIVVGEAGTEYVIPYNKLPQANTLPGANPLGSSIANTNNQNLTLSPQININNPIGGADRVLKEALDKADYLIKPMLVQWGFQTNK